MPEIKFQHVVSCSSEDETHEANNLLKPETYRKWKCATAGEKHATVILQFEKSSTVHSIDIGNEGSAFIEVLVGKSSSDKADEYQVILVTSSFMSPGDSKNGTNTNRVRFFGPNQLTKTVLDKSWDRVKVVCTQPFNKTTTYGLSFMKLHSTPAPGEQSSDKGNQATAQTPPVKRKSIDHGKSSTDKHAQKQSASSNDPSKRTTESSQQAPPMKKRKSDIAKPSPKKPFGELMEGVVFVISGFQNPHRSDIRDQAMEMGAKYKADWGKGCTHLICAFANTPKYQAVKGKGKIVQKGWILDSYKQKLLKPWKRYKLTNPDGSSSDETEEEDEEIVSPVKKQTKTKIPKPTQEDEDSETDNDMDTETIGTSSSLLRTSQANESSGSDTEDEIKRIQQSTAKEEDSYGSSTDVDTDNENNDMKTPNAKKNNEFDDAGGDIPELPDFFTDKRFLLYGQFDNFERRHLVRYITAFNGELEDYMSEVVSYIITNSQWDDNFDQALDDNAQLTFVRPKWIFACGDKRKMLPYQPYVVVPAP